LNSDFVSNKLCKRLGDISYKNKKLTLQLKELFKNKGENNEPTFYSLF